jgi:hypothetical protein
MQARLPSTLLFMFFRRSVLKLNGMVFLAVALAVGGCAKKTTVDGVSVDGEVGKPGTSLAYEHTVSVSVSETALSGKMSAVREACADERFGSCSLLRFEESSGRYPSGLLAVRIAPEGVEPLAALASKDARLGSRQTRAEDLAEAVADAAREEEQLNAQRRQLLDFQSRKDLTVADMISLAHEGAQVESRLAELERTSANLKRRIETNLLTVQFSTSESGSRWSSVGDSISDALDSLADGTSEAIEMIAFGIPFLIVLFPLALVWRWLWRRSTSERSAAGR